MILDGTHAGNRSGLKVVGAISVSVRNVAVINFEGHGVFFDESIDGDVRFCRIGIDPRTKAAAPNKLNGVAVRGGRGTFIVSNIINSNKGNGVYVADAERILVGANDVNENEAFGIFFTDAVDCGADNNTISRNRLSGVAIVGDRSTVGVGIFNRIYDNTLLGIDLGNDGPTPNHTGEVSGPNRLQNTAVIRHATRNNGFLQVDLDVDTTPGIVMSVAIFGSNPSSASPFVQGQRMLAFTDVTADSDGHATAHFAVPGVSESLVTATVTAVDPPKFIQRTSEFSSPATITEGDVVFRVTNTNDSGPGSLREALTTGNAAGCSQTSPCRVDFAIDGEAGSDGTFIIQPLTPLPAIVGNGLIIDGHSQTEKSGNTNPNGPEVVLNGSLCAAPCNGLEVRGQTKRRVDFVHIRDLVINGFHGDGIVITGTNAGNRIDGCYIGTDASGSAGVANDGSGLSVHDGALEIGAVFDNRIDRVTTNRPPRGNVISGNRGDGLLFDHGAFIYMYDNRIGTDRGGNEPLGNGGSGVAVHDSSVFDRVSGPPNRIGYNGKAGVAVTGASKAGFILAEIFDNAGLGIDLGGDGPTGNDPDHKIQNAPVIDSVVVDRAANKTIVEMTLDSPITGTTISNWLSFYSSPYADPSGRGEGHSLDSYALLRQQSQTSRIQVAIKGDLSGRFITATATKFDTFPYISVGNTSEFSNAVLAATPECRGHLAPLPLSPGAETVSSENPIVFRWSDVGAGEYALWVRPSTGKAAQQASSVGRTATVALSPGDYEWFVEAKFDGCSSVRSVPGMLSVR